MADWVRKTFDGIGPTQYPPGPSLPAVQEPYFGHVLLCIDVSGSMASKEGNQTRMDLAKRGAVRFIEEAVASNYRVGLILWNQGVEEFVPLDRKPDAVLKRVRAARIRGSNNICPALRVGVDHMASLRNDRVIAIFGDGDLGNRRRAKEAAAEATSHGIRILTRGLGRASASAFAEISTEEDDDALITTGGGIEEGIASMAGLLHGGRSTNSR